MSRALLSRANQIFNGRATLGSYQGGKPGAEVHLFYRWRPTGNMNAAFTVGLVAGATGGTLSAVWAGPTGLLPITFSDGEVLTGKFLNGNTAVTFYPANAPATGGGYGVPVQGSTANAGLAALAGPVTAAIVVGGVPPQLGVANSIALSQSIATGVPGLLNGVLSVGGVATPDVPRNVVAAWTGAAILTVTGTDTCGQVQTEASASGVAFVGKKAFATVTAITVSAPVTLATVGVGNVLGLPFRVASGEIFALTLADAPDAGTLVLPDLTLPATPTTGDVRGTYTTSGALNGQKYLAALIHPVDNTTQVGTFGVSPA